MKAAQLFLVAALALPANAQGAPVKSSPPQVRVFVSPSYPRLAYDGRMTGTTIARLKIDPDGQVIEAGIVSGHPIFGQAVVSALKQWKFAPDGREHFLEVICTFEFYDDGQCFRHDGQPATAQTVVSATLPTEVLVRASERCFTLTTNDPVERR